MIKPIVSLLMLGALSLPTYAHELWLERDGDGPVKVYLGEPDQNVIENGETIAALAPTTRIITPDSSSQTPISVKNDHLEANVDGDADVRAINDQVWKPWENDKGELTAALMHARWGRTDTEAQMDLELVPMAASSDRFTLLFKGQPLAETDVMLISPENQTRKLKTNEQGQVDLKTGAAGRYILAAGHETAANGQAVAGQQVDRLYHGTTTSFIAD
jgi:hypothetical protein